jgi:hypothetical protein
MTENKIMTDIAAAQCSKILRLGFGNGVTVCASRVFFPTSGSSFQYSLIGYKKTGNLNTNKVMNMKRKVSSVGRTQQTMCQGPESKLGSIRGAAPLARDFKYSPELCAQISPVFGEIPLVF